MSQMKEFQQRTFQSLNVEGLRWLLKKWRKKGLNVECHLNKSQLICLAVEVAACVGASIAAVIVYALLMRSLFSFLL